MAMGSEMADVQGVDGQGQAGQGGIVGMGGQEVCGGDCEETNWWPARFGHAHQCSEGIKTCSSPNFYHSLTFIYIYSVCFFIYPCVPRFREISFMSMSRFSLHQKKLYHPQQCWQHLSLGIIKVKIRLSYLTTKSCKTSLRFHYSLDIHEKGDIRGKGIVIGAKG